MEISIDEITVIPSRDPTQSIQLNATRPAGQFTVHMLESFRDRVRSLLAYLQEVSREGGEGDVPANG